MQSGTHEELLSQEGMYQSHLVYTERFGRRIGKEPGIKAKMVANRDFIRRGVCVSKA